MTARPSGDGAKTRTSGATSAQPVDLRSRSRTTDGRSRPTVWAKRRDPRAGRQLGRLGGAAEPLAPLEDERPQAGPREVRGGDERVVPATDDDVVAPPFAAAPRRAPPGHQAAFRPRARRTSIAAIRPLAPMIPPPGWVAEPHSQRSRIGVRNRA